MIIAPQQLDGARDRVLIPRASTARFLYGAHEAIEAAARGCGNDSTQHRVEHRRLAIARAFAAIRADRTSADGPAPARSRAYRRR